MKRIVNKNNLSFLFESKFNSFQSYFQILPKDFDTIFNVCSGRHLEPASFGRTLLVGTGNEQSSLPVVPPQPVEALQRGQKSARHERILHYKVGTI